MKKIIYIIAIIFLSIVVILNLIFTANLNESEQIRINFNSFIYILGIILLAVLLYLSAKVINKYLYKDDVNIEKKEKFRKKLFISVIVIYMLFNIIWAIMVNPNVVGDSVHVCNLAQTFYRGNLEEFFNNLTYAGIPLSEYMQSYQQQLSLAFVFSMIFRLIHFDIMQVLRVLNIICNILIVIAIYKINSQISKKYNTNKVLLMALMLTFISIPMLLTFIYGDIPSMALCLFSVYFIMKYIDTNKISNFFIASIFSMIAYMMRMNSLIFIIATVIYLLLNLINNFRKEENKKRILDIFIVILYIVISIIPSALVKNYYLDKYNLDKTKTYPNESYFLMAMEESPNGNGWYNSEIAEYALKNPDKAKDEYKEKIKNRLTFFSQNIGYTFNFYTMKLASMWTENTYSAIFNNSLEENKTIENFTKPLTFYQKALLILTCFLSLIVLIQNRKNLSFDVIYLITIFIGGFAFHILWEAKSRYIIPYILVLIPIAAININKIEKLKN